MTDADVIAAIRRQHLKANIDHWQRLVGYEEVVLRWDQATVDPGDGASLWGLGPYLHLPVDTADDRVMIRVYPPARLRRRLAAKWDRATSAVAPRAHRPT